VDVKCPSCGTENWLENQSQCFKCGAVLRRCVDCANYDGERQVCRTTQAEVDSRDAERPGLLSVSTNCPGYRCTSSVS